MHRTKHSPISQQIVWEKWVITPELWTPFSKQQMEVWGETCAERCTTWWLKTTQSHTQQLWAKGRQLHGDGLSNKDKSSKTTCPAEWDRGLSTRHGQNTAPSVHLCCVFEFSISACMRPPLFQPLPTMPRHIQPTEILSQTTLLQNVQSLMAF